MSDESTPTSDRRRVLGAAGLVGLVTLLSRMLGMVRDAFFSRALGHSWLSDVFLLAFEIPNLARRVLGEGSLSAFIVPIFTQFRDEHGEERGWRFANNALLTMTVFTGVLTVLCWFGAQWLFIAFGGAADWFRADDPTFVNTGTELVRIMIPVMTLLAVAAMMMGLLHSLGHFLAPALGSVVVNVVLIGVCVVGLDWGPENLIAPLAWATVAAATLRVAIMIPALQRRGWRWRPVFNPRSDGMLRLYAMMAPATFGLAIAHINISIDKILARWLGDGPATYLYHANHLTQFPLAIFASALATAMLPTLSKRLIEGDLPALHRTMNMSLRLSLLLFMPAMVGLIILARPIIAVIYEGQHFTAVGTAGTAWALTFYAVGMLPFAAHRLITPLYYARQDLRTPLRAGAIAVVVNIVLNLVFMNTALRHGGLALATSIATLVNVLLLFRWLDVGFSAMFDRALLRLFAQTLVLSAAMGAACWWTWTQLAPTFDAAAWGLRTVIALGLVAEGALLYAAGTKLLRIAEANEAWRRLVRR